MTSEAAKRGYENRFFGYVSVSLNGIFRYLLDTRRGRGVWN